MNLQLAGINYLRKHLNIRLPIFSGVGSKYIEVKQVEKQGCGIDSSALNYILVAL
jgi:hypothetical protein